MATSTPIHRRRPAERGALGECSNASCGSRFGARVISLKPCVAPAVEGAAKQGGARLPHQRHEEMYIVQGEEAQAEDLVGQEEVAYVRAREARAAGAVALRVQRPSVGAEL